MKVSIGTFNAENLFLRYKFFYSFKPRKGETEEEAAARAQKKLESLIKEGGYYEFIKTTLEDKKKIKAGQTSNTAKVIAAHKPDIMVFQEIESMDALRKFNSQYLKRLYKHAILITGNDLRGINVALLSNLPITYLKTNVDIKDPVTKKQLFSRDCLEVGVSKEEDGDTILTLFINHFKSQLARSQKEAENATSKRGRQAKWVADMLKKRYGQTLEGKFVVCGDLNQQPDAPELQSLLQLNGMENVVQKKALNNLKVPGLDAVSDSDRWTHYYEGEVSQLDYILLSPDLAEASADEDVIIEKQGFADYVDKWEGKRFDGVGPEGTEASDHAGVFTTINV